MTKKNLALIAIVFTITCSLYGDFWIGTGWREDTLHWNMAGPDDFPNVLSELTWDNIQMWNISAGYEGRICSSLLYYKINADYGKIFSGDNHDYDFLGDDRTLLFSESKALANHGEAFDFNVGIGYPFFDCFECIDFIPMIGYSYNVQHLTMRKGHQVYDRFFGYTGPIKNLHSHYYSNFMTGWIGLDANYNYSLDTKFGISAEYHFGEFRAKGHWNLRRDFVDDFRHEGNAFGFVISGFAEIRIYQQLFAGLNVSYTDMHVNKGTDTIYFYEGDQKWAGKTRLNSVHWRSIKIDVTVAYEF